MVDAQPIHASTVALDGRGVLIRGRSGRGKSSLALQLMALGCDLVADDQTIVTLQDSNLIATCPAVLRGRIEARGLGILKAKAVEAANLVLVIDLDQTENDRIPLRRSVKLNGIEITVMFRVDSSHFPAAILQYLKAGRSE